MRPHYDGDPAFGSAPPEQIATELASVLRDLVGPGADQDDTCKCGGDDMEHPEYEAQACVYCVARHVLERYERRLAEKREEESA